MAQVFPQFDKKIGKYGAGGASGCGESDRRVCGVMEHLDNEIGALLKLLDELGVDDNTLVMFNSDNGAHKEAGMIRCSGIPPATCAGINAICTREASASRCWRWPGKVRPAPLRRILAAFRTCCRRCANYSVNQCRRKTPEFHLCLHCAATWPSKDMIICISNLQGGESGDRLQAVRAGDWKASRRGQTVEFSISRPIV